MVYQDRLGEDGQVLEAGYRECADRYEVVRQAVEGLRRPFTVLDLGASSGYFSIRLTEEFGARCVAVERTDVITEAKDRVAAIVRANLNAEQIRKQGSFDVILALSFLHHQPKWRGVLKVLERHTRSALIVETPNPAEKLRQAPAREELGDIEQALRDLGMRRIGTSPGVWDPTLERGIWLMRRDGIRVQGVATSGSGQNGNHALRFRKDVTDLLGYEPFPGSLNVKLPRAFRLGAYALQYVDRRRGKGGRRGGDYQLWHAKVEGYDGPAHVMRPGIRGHGRDVLEVWAPERLRDVLGVEDGDPVALRVGA